MSVPEYLARVRDRVDLTRLGEIRVVIFGLGTVGSPIAVELGGSGVRRFRLLDGDVLEPANIVRHVCKQPYVGRNKAESVADLIRLSYPPESTEVEYYPCFVDGAMSDNFLDELIQDADLVIAATDDRRAQRRIAERALALDVPAVFPALYPDGGGEVFVQLGPGAPCLLCWEAFRPAEESLRAVTALNVEAVSVIGLAVQLALGVLDPSSTFARLFAGTPTDREPRTLFVMRPHASVQYVRVSQRPNCPTCQVGPAAGQTAVQPSFTVAAETWGNSAERFVRTRPGVSIFGAWTAIILLVAMFTGSGWATFFATTMIITTMWLVFRPSFDQLARRLENLGGIAGFGGVLCFALFLAALISGSGLVVLFMAVALISFGLFVLHA
jgi:molybdopterin/thiamine biosynthesis adenylyltransferase